MKPKVILLLFLIVISSACKQKKDQNENQNLEPEKFLGADLSYINEMEDCGGKYRVNGEEVDPYELFAESGANLVRLRLWHNPQWTDYSNFSDIKKSIERAKENGMKILLDFHYSDTWADPQKQIIPAAWETITDIDVLGDSVYQYTYKVLNSLHGLGLCPELIQVGNEINIEILQHEGQMNLETINWERNNFLLNRAIQAVNDVSEATGCEFGIMLHIAQPENVDWWFDAAMENGLQDFDWIGISYYPKWSTYRMLQMAEAIKMIKQKYGKKVMIVETAYPYTLDNADHAPNILGEDALVSGYPATPAGQLDYLNDLRDLSFGAGCDGVVYWEPAWISTNCATPWGIGSHWDNATFFDAMNNNEALITFDFFAPGYK